MIMGERVRQFLLRGLNRNFHEFKKGLLKYVEVMATEYNRLCRTLMEEAVYLIHFFDKKARTFQGALNGRFGFLSLPATHKTLS